MAEKVEKTLLIEEKNNKYGVIDSDGKIIIPFEYRIINKPDKIYSGEDVFFIVHDDGYFGAFDYNGKIVFPCEYDYLEDFFDRKRKKVYFIFLKDGKWGMMDSNGEIEIIHNCDFDYIWGIGRKSPTLFLEVGKDDKIGIIDINGKIIQPFI